MSGLFSSRIRSLSSVSPFTGPETLERRRGETFNARLGANESVFGPSPKAIEAMARNACESWMYGDPDQFDLREALAQTLDLQRENIVCGVGIDGLLRDLIAISCEPGSPVLTSRGAYPTFAYFATAAGAVVATVPYTPNFRQDWGALIDRAKEIRPKILYLTNPDNPTGSWRNAADFADVLTNVPDDTIIALDEAYCDFAPEDATPSTKLTKPNLLRFRTFSKAYGMAGARVGYVFGDASTIAEFEKVRDHFAVSRLSQVGALAALADGPFLAKTVDQVAKGRILVSRVAERCGFRALPSATNFVAIDLEDPDFCRHIADAIEKRGVFIRRPGAEFLNRTVRISVGTTDDIEHFEQALVESLKAVAR